jgi:Zn-dependent alcohol dehydrogenase
MRIRAAVLEEFAQPLVITDVELDGPDPGEALIRLAACGVCHTDMYTASGADPSGYAPTVLGHEGAGVVEAVGEGVTSLAPGDHVITLFSPQCRECLHCRSDKTNLCRAIREQQNLGYLPDGSTRLHRGDERILCVDLDEGRLASARGHGATDTFIGGADAVQQILDMTDGFGADYTFEATGNVKVMRQAVEAARMGWGLCTVAGVAGRGETLDVVPRYLITGRRIAGASFGGAKGRDRVPELVDLYVNGELDLDAFVTRRIALDEVNDAFAAMDRHEGVRTVITSF